MADYLTYYRLKESPFRTKADPRFFYLSDTHLKAIRSVIDIINEKDGFSVLYGDYGLGKSTIAKILDNEYAERKDYHVALLNSVGFATPRSLLRGLADEFHMRESAKALSALLEMFNRFTYEYAVERGQTLIALIDEAQYLTPKHLELLREIINFEVGGQENLVQIVLIGTPELLKNLKKTSILYKRVTCVAGLAPFNQEETEDMIEFRLNVAGCRERLFTEAALTQIYRSSHGVPRSIVKLCARGLAIGAEHEHEHITVEDIREAIDRYGMEDERTDD